MKRWNRKTTAESINDALDVVFGKTERSKNPFKMTVVQGRKIQARPAPKTRRGNTHDNPK